MGPLFSLLQILSGHQCTDPHPTIPSTYLQQAMDMCDEMRALRLNPTREGYAFIATVAIKDDKTYLIARTLDTMKQEGFSAEVRTHDTAPMLVL